jgi:molecular chaperone DnaK
MIDRNTTIPVKKTQTFSNAAPMQPAATILIGQGERKMFEDNKLLGQFNVELTPQPQPGMNQISITYEIDANGILHVSAKDIALNKEANITITSSSGLSKDEIEKAKREAEEYAEADQKKLDLINEKNKLASMCNNIERSIKDMSDKITEDDKIKINDAILKAKESLKADKINDVTSANETLIKVWEPIVTKLYPHGQTGTQPNFSAEDFEKMKNDPKFAAMFNNMNANNTTTNSDGSIDAEVVSD